MTVEPLGVGGASPLDHYSHQDLAADKPDTGGGIRWDTDSVGYGSGTSLPTRDTAARGSFAPGVLAFNYGVVSASASAYKVSPQPFSDDELKNILALYKSDPAGLYEQIKDTVGNAPWTKVGQAMRQLEANGGSDVAALFQSAMEDHFIANYNRGKGNIKWNWPMIEGLASLNGKGAPEVKARMLQFLATNIDGMSGTKDLTSDVKAMTEMAERILVDPATGDLRPDAAETFLALYKQSPEQAEHLVTAFLTHHPQGGQLVGKLLNKLGATGAEVSAGVAMYLMDRIKSSTDPAVRAKLSYALGEFFANNPHALMKVMQSPTHAKEVGNLIGFLLKNGGDKAREQVGQMVAGLTDYTAKNMLNAPNGSQKAYYLGRFLAAVEQGIKQAAGSEKEQIEFGAKILRYSVKAIEKLSGSKIPLVGDGIDALEKYEKGQVDKAWNQFNTTLTKMVGVGWERQTEAHAKKLGKPISKQECDQTKSGHEDSAACKYEEAVTGFLKDINRGYDDMKNGKI